MLPGAGVAAPAPPLICEVVAVRQAAVAARILAELSHAASPA